MTLAAAPAGHRCALRRTRPTLSNVEKIYAELAALPKAERAKRIEDGRPPRRQARPRPHAARRARRRPRRALPQALSVPGARRRRRDRLAGRRRAAACRRNRRPPPHRCDRHRGDGSQRADPPQLRRALSDARRRGAAAAISRLHRPREQMDPVVLERARHLLQHQPGAEGQGAEGVERSLQSVLQGQRLVRSGGEPVPLRSQRHAGRGGTRASCSNASAGTTRSSSAATPSAWS